VTATGHYLPDKQVVARLRVAEGDQAMEVLLPFVVDGGPTVLVDRGYVRPLPGSRVPPIPPPPRDAVTLTARLRDSEGPVLDKKSFVSDGVRQVYSINVSQIATFIGVPLAGSYLQLVDNQPGGLGVIGLPHLDAGPFLSYGIQWITFGVVAPILLGYFVYAEIRARRAEKSHTSPTKPSEPATVEDKLNDRYGRRR
jgi:cytochrome oxidase assembly protein ShyY1